MSGNFAANESLTAKAINTECLVRAMAFAFP